MEKACANKNSREWKIMVKQTGETLAELAFIANGYRMPDVKTREEIKTELGFKSRVEDLTRFKTKLRNYNKKYGTSHYYTSKKIYGNTFEVELKYNYLPVNVEKQRQRLAERNPEKYSVAEFNPTEFNDLYPTTPQVFAQPTPKNSLEEEARKIQEEDAKRAGIEYSDSYLYEDDLPSVKPGVAELFDSNPELANQVYEALGFQGNIFENKILNGFHWYDYEGNTYSKEDFDKEIEKQDLLKPNNVIKIEYKQSSTPAGDIFNVFYVDENKAIEVLNKYNINKSIEIFIKESQDKVFTGDEKLAIDELYGKQEITPQEKQQALQLYSQYLDTIFPDSKVKDIVYHGTKGEKFDKFKSSEKGEFGKGVYFGNYQTALENTDETDDFTLEPKKGFDKNKIISAIINTQNTYTRDLGNNGTRNEYVVEPEQIRILGGKEDIEGFKEFVDTDLYTDELLASAPSEVEAVEKKRRDKIHSEIIRQRQLVKKETDPSIIRRTLAKIDSLKSSLEDADSRVLLTQNIKAFEDVELFGKKQLKEIEQLLNNNAITTNDVLYADRVLSLWIKAGDFSTEADQHIFLDEDEFNSSDDITLADGTVIPSIRTRFRTLAAKAQDLQSKVTTLRKQHTTEFVKQYTSDTLTQEEIFKNIRDISKSGSMTLNQSRHNDPMLSAGFYAIEQANMKAVQEASEMWDTLDNLTTKFLKKSGGNFNILKQLTADGKETGRAVSRFSDEFYTTRKRLMKAAFWNRDAKTKKLKPDANKIKEFFRWTNENTITFDPRILFPDANMEDGIIPQDAIYNRVTFSEGAKQEHIAELKAQLGEKGYEYYIQRVEKKIERFKLEREAIYEKYQLDDKLTDTEKEVNFETWNRENSPYWNMDMMDNPVSRQKGKDGYYTPKGLKPFTEQVPRRTVKGETTKWYDKNFEKIEADEDLLAYHSYMMDMLNTSLYSS